MSAWHAPGMYDVEGKTAVVTGAASGIGLGMARAFGGAGMRLVLADIEADRLDGVVAELTDAGQTAIGVRTDVSDADQVAALAEAALAEFGAVHLVANNAGVGVGGALDEMSIDDWRWIVDVNLWGVVHGVRTFLPILKRQGEGHISATASMAGLVGGPILGAYHTTKHAVVGLMDSVRGELADEGSAVRASVLCPGAVDTNVTTSVRNRPDGLSPHVTTDGEARYWERLTATLAAGMAPDEVGELALDAVREERFWILTHPEWQLPVLDRRLRAQHDDHAHRTP